jgi:hypothetical protein
MELSVRQGDGIRQHRSIHPRCIEPRDERDQGAAKVHAPVHGGRRFVGHRT